MRGNGIRTYTIDDVRKSLETDDKALMRGLLRIYAAQTEDEKEAKETTKHNSVGFNGTDANILSSFAEQLVKKRTLSPKQLAICRKKMPKYAKQIFLQMVQGLTLNIR
jgi:hypothetical protein